MLHQDNLSSSGSTTSVVEDNLEGLQSNLSSAVLLRNTLECQIDDLVYAITSGPCGALSLFPTEVHLEIFPYTVTENSMFIGSLLRVCKSWYQMIRGSPSLWSIIHIKIPPDTRSLKECVDYCATCIKYSAAHLLDISIDYTALELLDRFRERGIDAKRLEISSAASFRNVFNWHLTNRDSGEDALYKYYQNHYFLPLKFLAGDDFSVMARWKFFEFKGATLLHLLSVPCAAFALHMFRGNTPFLESLKIVYLNNYLMRDNIPSYIATRHKSSVPAFPYCPRLREMVISMISGSMNDIGVDPLNIQVLRIHFFEPEFLEKCRNVFTMHIGLSNSALEGVRTLPPQSLQFNRLNRLELGMLLPPWFFHLIEAPLLNSISFVQHTAFRLLSGTVLPSSVSKVECRWAPHCDYGANYWTGLSSVIHSPSVTILLFTRTDKETIRRTLQMLSEASSRSMSLSTLLVVPSYKCEESNDTEVIRLGVLV